MGLIDSKQYTSIQNNSTEWFAIRFQQLPIRVSAYISSVHMFLFTKKLK